MRIFILIAVALCLGLATQACRDSSLFPIDPSGKKHKPNDSVNVRLTLDQVIGQQWQLQSYGSVGGTPTPIAATETLTLALNKEHSLGGLADCNSYGADYTAGPNSTLTITNIGQTKVYCGNDKWDREYLIALGEAVTWDATPEALHIYYHGGSMVLNFVKAGAIKPSGGGQDPNVKYSEITQFPGITWKLVSFETLPAANMPGQVTMLTDQNYTLTIPTVYATNIEGDVNCNTYAAQFTTGSDFAFTVTGLGSTKVNCPGDQTLDAAYLDALSGAQKAVAMSGANGISLDITYANGGKVLHYTMDHVTPATLKNAYGIKWKLIAIGQIGGGMETPADPNNVPWIEFSPDGTMRGSSYCSPFSGFFQEGSGNALSLFNINWQSAPACPYDEIQLLNVLMTAVSYDMGGDQLIINATDNMRAVFSIK
jgi:heat shock protein HslJ